jgi:polar amino acid transport system substrate-binding protein
MKNKIIIIFPLLCVLFIGCSKNVSSPTIQKGVLSVGVEIGYPPMEYFGANGVLLGFDIDLIYALAEKLGLKVNLFDTAWDSILAGLDADRYDIAVNVTVLPERQKKYNFTKPYINSFMTIVTRTDSKIKIDKAEDIAGYRAAFQGNTTAQYFSERLNNRNVRFTSFSYDKIINCFGDLKLGRVDLVIVDNIVAYYYTGTENSGLQIAWADTDSSSDELIAICLKKGSDALTGIINKALDEMTADGTVAAISDRYFLKTRNNH